MAGILVVGKYPPIQGGVATSVYEECEALAHHGHTVHVVTNADSVESGYRCFLTSDDSCAISRQNGITVHTTSPSDRMNYVPWAKPFLTKLLGESLSVLNNNHIDLVFGSYFEPYGIAGALISRMASLPFVLRHAGSDIARLSLDPSLSKTYRWMLSQASRVLTNHPGSPTRTKLIELGCSEDILRPLLMSRLPAGFSDVGETFGLSDFINEVRGAPAATLPFGSLHSEILELNNKSFNPTTVTVGVYGKVGVTKGSFALLDALATCATEGKEFNFISVAGGTQGVLDRYWRQVLTNRELAVRSWLLPFLPPWRVPSFIRLCQAICFLEKDFPIHFHSPRVPREVLACGRCLIATEEIAKKQPFSPSLVDQANIVLIQDPHDRRELSYKLGNLFDDGPKRHSIARHGFFLSRVFESILPRENTICDALQDVLATSSS